MNHFNPTTIEGGGLFRTGEKQTGIIKTSYSIKVRGDLIPPMIGGINSKGHHISGCCSSQCVGLFAEHTGGSYISAVCSVL